MNNDGPGKYLVQLDTENPGVQRNCSDKDYNAIISIPTPYGISLARVLLDNTVGDIDIVHSLQNNISITPQEIARDISVPPLNLTNLKAQVSRNTSRSLIPEITLNLTAQLARYNEPEVIGDRTWVNATLMNAGIKNGMFQQVPGTNLSAVVGAANASAIALQTTAGFNHDLGNNWTIQDPRIMGNYYSFYASRYRTSVAGYLALTDDQAIYPLYQQVKIGADEAAVFTFSRKPVMKKHGFWSMTVYGDDAYLIPNDIDRYALGDRSNMTFPNGTKLSAPVDGQFQILLQPADVAPPSNWTNK